MSTNQHRSGRFKVGEGRRGGRRATSPRERGRQLGDQLGEIEALVQAVAAIGDQAADAQGGAFALGPAHRTVAFLDPPADGALAGVVGAIEKDLPVGNLPVPVEGQARPERPAVEEEVAQAIGLPAGAWARPPSPRRGRRRSR